MGISSKIRTIFRGDVSFLDLPREALRRSSSAARRRVERGELDTIDNTGARLSEGFRGLAADKLLMHFCSKPRLIFSDANLLKLYSQLFPDEASSLGLRADGIKNRSSWDLAGFGVLEFKGANVWRRDPLGRKDWGSVYHADLVPDGADGADIRVLWEANRFGHLFTLAQSFLLTEDDAYAETFFDHIESWMMQNPYGRGANWHCAMEVALRAVNVLAGFELVRLSKACNEERLARVLTFFDQHGRFISNNDEFSYIVTSNHYLSDVVGLFWIGVCLPELKHGSEWASVGLRGILSEIDKQILADGADFEASTGYHKFVTEMLLYTFMLAKRAGVEVPGTYWDKLRQMLEYTNGIVRRDGRMPLIGDADGSQIVPMVKRDSDEAAYLLALGAVVFDEPQFKKFSAPTPELLWLLGEDGVNAFSSLRAPEEQMSSIAFPDAGSYVLRDADLYLHFNANGCGTNGRGAHAHNDALSIEVSAYGREFIIDPGSFVYNLDREARHLFRSTAYHSTVTVDGVEQSAISVEEPFIIGNEASPNVLSWETSTELDRVVAEHYGYRRLKSPVDHRRTVEFNKTDKYWRIVDSLTGRGEHKFAFSFHLAGGLRVEIIDGAAVCLGDDAKAGLLIAVKGVEAPARITPASRSRTYGDHEDTQILRWDMTAAVPLNIPFFLIPVAPCESRQTRLALLRQLTQNTL